jgi:maleylpyruvate isomerase
MTTTVAMSATFSRHVDWMTDGHRYLGSRLAQLGDDELSAPSALPGWTRRHLLSHLGHNARALRNLVHWAATGEPTPMYSAPAARASEIDSGASWEPQRLRAFVEAEQGALATALAQLDGEQLGAEVITAQGRQVRAAVLPWLRTRELWIHAVDLHRDADFSDFPAPLLDKLLAEVLRWRRDVRGETLHVQPTDREPAPALGDQQHPGQVVGRAADLARWATGRGAVNIRTTDDSPLPILSAWL